MYDYLDVHYTVIFINMKKCLYNNMISYFNIILNHNTYIQQFAVGFETILKKALKLTHK